MKLIAVTFLLFSAPAVAQTCLAGRPPDLYSSRSCWEAADSNPDGREYVYISFPTVEKILDSEFAPIVDDRTAESISLKEIRNYVSGDGEKYAALYLQDRNSPDFQSDECNIHSVENDAPGHSVETFIAPSFLRDLGKNCEDVKLTIAFFVNNVAAVETVRASLRNAGIEWAGSSDLLWAPVVAAANVGGVTWEKAFASAKVAGFSAQPLRADAVDSQMVAKDVAIALEANQLAFVFDPTTSQPVAVMSKLANLSSEEEFKNYRYDDYLLFYPKGESVEAVASSLNMSAFIDGNAATPVAGQQIDPNNFDSVVVGRRFTELAQFIEIHKEELARLGLFGGL